MLLEHEDVTVVIEMVVASRITGRCTRWLPGSGVEEGLNCNLHSFQLLEIIQVLDSISLGPLCIWQCLYSIES